MQDHQKTHLLTAAVDYRVRLPFFVEGSQEQLEQIKAGLEAGHIEVRVVPGAYRIYVAGRKIAHISNDGACYLPAKLFRGWAVTLDSISELRAMSGLVDATPALAPATVE